MTLYAFFRIKRISGSLKKDIQSDQSQIYRDLLDGKTDIDWDGLDGTLEYINGQYDCANFRMVI